METTIADIVERLAYEGVPIAALTRATLSPRDEIYDALRSAMELGRLVCLPPADWPPGQKSKARMGSGRTSQVDPGIVLLKLMTSYGVTRQQALLMREMLVRPQATREQLYEAAQQAHDHGEDTEPKIVQVVICKLRKRLVKHRVKIVTIWSGGYYIPLPHRKRVFEKIQIVGDLETETT